MSNEYKWESPNSPIVDYGGPILGGIILWLMLLFYPAVVVGVQAGQWGADPIGQAIVGVGTLIAIWVLWKIAVSISNNPYSSSAENTVGFVCWLIVVGLYIVCLAPFIQYIMWIWGDYSASGYEAEFPGFDWFWFIPSSDNELWNWGIVGEAVWDWFKMAVLIAVITYSICGVIIMFKKMIGK